jgi:L-asparaginase
MQTIYLITTGGTIEKQYSVQTCTVVNSETKIVPYMRRLRLPDADVRVVPLMNKDSLEVTDADRTAIVAKVVELADLECPIVITHGTDTLVETGLAIEKAIPDLRAPVILTGAMKPLGFDRSDGLQNLAESLLAARLLDPGVHVVFHSQVIPVGEAYKDKRRGTFAHKTTETETEETSAAEADEVIAAKDGAD